MKFHRTYYTKPYKDHKVEFLFDRGYLNVQVLVDGVEIATYKTAFQLLETHSVDIPNSEDTLQFRFLKDTVEFEVFYNDVQIDNSETSSKIVTNSLSWAISVIIGWYSLVLLVMLLFDGDTRDYIYRYPSSIYSEPYVIYIFTGTIVVLITYIILKILLKQGRPVLFKVAMILMAIDALYSIGYMILAASTSDGEFGALFFGTFLLPNGIRGLVLYSMITNYKKYEEYASDVNSLHNKGVSNPETLDL